MDEPITWSSLLSVSAIGAVGFLVVLIVYGVGRHFGWWANDDGPGVE